MMQCSKRIFWVDEFVGIRINSTVYWYCPYFDFWMIDGSDIIHTTFTPAEVPELFMELYGDS